MGILTEPMSVLTAQQDISKLVDLLGEGNLLQDLLGEDSSESLGVQGDQTSQS